MRPFNLEHCSATNTFRIVLDQHISAHDHADLTAALQSVPALATVEIDGTRLRSIHHDPLAAIYAFQRSAVRKRIRLTLKGIPAIRQ
jgi:hypothetical protein